MRRAFTIFELILAIIIIGIASASLPMILSSANKADEDTINQDIIFKSTGVMNDITSRFWDGSMYNQGSIMIATVNGGDTKLNNPRVGFFSRSAHNNRIFYPTVVNASAIVNANTALLANDTPTGIEFYNGRFIDETAGAAKVRYNIAVAYVPDTVDDNTQKSQTLTWNLGGGASANSTNLKRITITATRTKLNGDVYTSVFSYFASNIGSQELKTK